MAYCKLEDVKSLMDTDDTEDDVKIGGYIDTADAVIDNALKAAGVTVPLAAPTEVIKRISKFMAAGLFLQKNAPNERPHAYYTMAMDWLKSAVQTYHVTATTTTRGLAFATGEADQ